MERMLRLLKQKKMWCEKLTRAVNRRIFDLKELEKMEAEKVVRVGGTSRSLSRGSFGATYKLIGTKGRYHPSLQKANEWLLLSNFVLSFGLLADLGIFGNVETLFNIRSDF